MASDRQERLGHEVHRPRPPARIYLSNEPREQHSRAKAAGHAEKRAQERHGIILDDETRHEVESEIRRLIRRMDKVRTKGRLTGNDGPAGFVERLGRSRLSCCILIKGQIRYVIYDEDLRRLVTVLAGPPR